MAKFIFVRHGQSQTNIENRFAGQNETPLTEMGEKQAELLCNWIFENYKIDFIYSSSLSRAYKTALPYAKKTGIEIIKSDMLKEMNAGEWQGKRYVDIKDEYPEEFYIWKNDIGNVVLPSGESAKEVAERIVSEIISIAEKHLDKNIMVVTHGMAIRVMMAIFQKGDIRYAQEIGYVPNASVTVANYENSKMQFELIGYDDFLVNIKSSVPANLI